ncbi:hypothetical protein WLZ34_03370 [Thermogladius sp. KZ2Tp1]|uniref:hypothetical protein n=1 Tax=Thermogladius sp. KZ2Tp1 TaxID=3136289 RepID=UPI003DA9BDC6
MKGVEGLVAAALLLVITVAGGLLLYNYVMNYLSLPQQYVSLKVVSAKIVVLDSTSSMLTIQVSNLGNIPANITGVTVYTRGGAYSVSLSNQVPAGSTIAINVGLNSTVTSAVVASSQVYISVNYTSNGSSGATDLVKVPVY